MAAAKQIIIQHSESYALGPLPPIWRVSLYHQGQEVHSFLLGRATRIRRTKGRVSSGCTWYTGRKLTMGGWKLSQSRWHNPYKAAQALPLATSLDQYQTYITSQAFYQQIWQLQGHVLGCFCPVMNRRLTQVLEQPICHNELLLRLMFYAQYQNVQARYPGQAITYTVSEIAVEAKTES